MAHGAGGTEGGVTRFLMGLAMLVGGGYLFFDSIRVTSGFHWGHALFNLGGFGLTTGMVLIPFVFGIGIVFYNVRNPLGWLLSAGSLLALCFGVLRGLRFNLQTMSSFNLIVILVLLFGGLGLFVSSLRSIGNEVDQRADAYERTGRVA